MKSVRDIPHLENIPVLLRIPQVVNSVRLASALPTIEFLRKHHARVILATHISGKGTESAEPMFHLMKEAVRGLKFSPVSTGPAARTAARALLPGEVLMLENLRRNPGEEKNDPEFAKELASLADVFVQDSFDTCHRKHASIVGVPELLPSYAGLSLESEVQELSKALSPKRPSLAIISGAKFSTKEPVLRALLKTYDRVFVGGALANDFLKAKGFSVGVSLVSGEGQDKIRELLKEERLLIPIDAIVAPPHALRNQGRVTSLEEVAPEEAVLDAGPKTTAMLAELIGSAKTILWNGPLGYFEGGFTDGTYALARAIASSKATSIVGGGDTIAAIEALGVSDEFSFISTGGGAMLDYLADGSLPGLDALG